MPYLIYAEDYNNKDHIRESIRISHRDYLKSIGKHLLASGALLSDDGLTVIGGISLVDFDEEEDALKFANNDPYAKAGIRKTTKIIKWRKRWWDGEFLCTGTSLS